MEMPQSNSLALSDSQAIHRELMQAILRSVRDTPLVLKGGTALYLCYGLNRFSEDLDFDSPKKLNLINKIQNVHIPNVTIKGINVKKDTDTVSRYAIHYTINDNPDDFLLKVEVSYRTPPSIEQVTVQNNISVLKPSALIENKLLAAFDGEYPRSKARDLFDLHFLAKNYGEVFSEDQMDRLSRFAENPDKLLSTYLPDYMRDNLVNKAIDIETLVLDLHELSRQQNQKLDLCL